MILKKVIPFAAFIISLNAYAEQGTFDQYVTHLRQEAIAKGFSKELVGKAFADIKLRHKVIHQDKNQPEFKLTLDTYIPRALPDWKVAKARQVAKKYHDLLIKLGKKYQVQPRFIVALWGIESNFGRLTGHYDLMSSLTSLAYDGRRGTFFKKQVMAVLTIMRDEAMSRDQLKGSWAGAMGQVQFMPTTYLAYAVDEDGDGKRDIWHSVPDALGSAANYLHQLGWRNDLTWGRQVKLTQSLSAKQLEKEQARSLSQWNALGVRRYNLKPLPKRDVQAHLVIPDDKHGRIYLTYANYQALLKWNRSNYFAVTVGILADRIGYPPIK